MDEVRVRACGPGDAFALAVIGAATFVEAFAAFIPGEAILAHCRAKHTEAAYTTFFEGEQTRGWIAEVAGGGGPVGYALLTAPEFSESLARARDLELRRLYLFSRFHGGGAGRQMMELAVAAAVAQRAERLLLGVHPENQRALAFYKRTGFRQIGERRFHVGPSVFVDPVLALEL